MNNKCKYGVIVIVLLLCLLFTACKKDEARYGDDNTNSNKLNMGYSLFDMRDDFVYFTNHGNIFEYDMIEKKTVVFDKVGGFVWGYVDAHQDKVTYAGSYMMANQILEVTRDGKELSILVPLDKEQKETPTYYYIEDDICYVVFANQLRKIDLKTGDTEILFELDKNKYPQIDVLYVTETHIYVSALFSEEILTTSDNVSTIWRSPRNKIQFEEMTYGGETSAFYTNLLEVDDILYVTSCKRKGFNLFSMTKDGEIIQELPKDINTMRYCVLGDVLYYIDYMDEDGNALDERPVRSYNMKTGEYDIIIDDYIDEFTLLEDRYIAALDYYAKTAYLYDLQTGEMVDMLAEDVLIS